MIPLIDLKSEYQFLKDDIWKTLEEVLESGKYILGEKGAELEKKIAEYIGCSHAIGVANGTDALLLSLEASGISQGDEVITTPFSFFATAEIISRLGATPVFVDIDSETFNINPDLIEQAITVKTKAIIIVHLFGQSAEMDCIMEIARKYNLIVIEDACQAIGATFKEKRVGSFGHVGCFSFFPSKNLGAYGDGGMIVTNSQDLDKKIRIIRNHGSSEKYIHKYIGINSRLDEIQAAILLVKIKKLDEWNERRREIAKRYSEQLIPFVKIPIIHNQREHVFHQYCILIDNRPQLLSFLRQRGIATDIYYPIPIHLQQAYQFLGYKVGDFPVAESIAKRILALPVHPYLSESQQDYIISSVKEWAAIKK